MPSVPRARVPFQKTICKMLRGYQTEQTSHVHTSPSLRRNDISQFPHELCSTYKPLLSGAHAKIEVRAFARGATTWTRERGRVGRETGSVPPTGSGLACCQGRIPNDPTTSARGGSRSGRGGVSGKPRCSFPNTPLQSRVSCACDPASSGEKVVKM